MDINIVGCNIFFKIFNPLVKMHHRRINQCSTNWSNNHWNKIREEERIGETYSSPEGGCFRGPESAWLAVIIHDRAENDRFPRSSAVIRASRQFRHTGVNSIFCRTFPPLPPTSRATGGNSVGNSAALDRRIFVYTSGSSYWITAFDRLVELLDYLHRLNRQWPA